MAFIQWTQKDSVGIAVFDEHHKKLFALVNDLHSAMVKGQGKAALSITLNQLVDYTVFHFKAEEDMMQKYAFPGLAAHRVEHQDLVKQVAELQARHESGEAMLSLKVMSFLKEWLNKHINVTDKLYGVFLNSKGVY